MAPIQLIAVFGTRPEAIKMAPLVQALQCKTEHFALQVAVTAQHREMLDQVLELFQITPDYDLDIMEKSQSLAQITTRGLEGLSRILASARPQMVLVHGDTTTTLVGALAAFYLQIPVAHVEAGLRTHQKYFPFPEEINRHLTGVLADLHFAPTPAACKNLLAEGIKREAIWVTGNTIIDALSATVRPDYPLADHPGLGQIDFSRRVILVTAHRRENWGQPMRQVFTALQELVAKFPDVEVVFPVHKNPQLRQLAREMLAGRDRCHLIEPLEYAPFANLMAHSYLVLTDSGGLQEEAPALGKPVLVMRDVTERPEAVEAGTVRLVGTSTASIVEQTSLLLEDPRAYQAMANAVNPYGDGRAVPRIIQGLEYYFGWRSEPPEEFKIKNKESSRILVRHGEYNKGCS